MIIPLKSKGRGTNQTITIEIYQSLGIMNKGNNNGYTNILGWTPTFLILIISYMFLHAFTQAIGLLYMYNEVNYIQTFLK